MPEVATPNQGEREFETSSDEFAKAQNNLNQAASAGQDRLAWLNAKRTYDVYQDLDIQTARQAQVEATRLNNIAAQALQNAVETANLASKQHLQLNALAHDSFWNPVAAGTGMNLTAGAIPANRATDVAAASAGVAAAGVAVSAEAISAAVGIAVNAALTPLIAQLASIANVIAQVQPKPTPSA